MIGSRLGLVVSLALACGLVIGSASCSDPAPATTVKTPPTTDAVAPITFNAVFVVNGGDHTISVINSDIDEVAGVIQLHGLEYPHHVYLSADRSRMLVAVPGTDLSGGHSEHDRAGAAGGSPGAVLMLDATTGRLLAARRMDAMNHNAIYAPNGIEIWTSQHDGRVAVLDGLTLATKQTIGVGEQPSEVTFSSDGRNAFVADTGSAAISIIDPTTKAVTKVIRVGATPVGAWQGTNGIAYVDNESDGTISAIDTASLEVVATWQLGFTPGMVAYGPDGNVWVADPYNSRVVVRKAMEDAVIGDAKAAEGTHGIVFSPDGKKAYASNQVANTVSVINVATRAHMKEIPVGSKPNGMVSRAKD